MECASSLLAEISRLALNRPHRPLRLKFEIGGGFLGKDVSVNCGLPPALGAEVSGVLMGRREASRVLICAFRPMPVQPESPTAVPSIEAWEGAFGGLIARARWAPELAGLQPLGWFRAHPKASMTLSRRDQHLFDRFFREPWHVGVVLQPADGSAHGRFFAREETESQDVVVRWGAEPARTPIAPGDKSANSRQPLRPGRRELRAKPAPIWPAVLLAVGLGAGAWWMLRPPQAASSPVAQHALTAPDVDRDSASQAAALWQKWEDEARQQEKSAPVEPEAGSAKPPDPSPSNAESRRAAVGPPLPLTRDPEKSDASSPPARQPSLQALSGAASRRPDPPPNQPVLPTPPSALEPDRPPVAPLPGEIPTVPNPSPPPPVAKTSPATTQISPPVTAAATRSSGRLIWTGRLRKNEDLVLDGTRASVGSSSGALPGFPIRFSVSPGDLTKEGITVYTARLHVPGGTAEPPGPQNGWNRTVYTWDPARGAADLELVEAPGPQNGWKRLVLRAKNPHDSVIFVEWSARP